MNKAQQQYNNNSSNNINSIGHHHHQQQPQQNLPAAATSNAIINHFDRSLQQNTRKSCFNLINTTSFGANNPPYLLALRNKK